VAVAAMTKPATMIQVGRRRPVAGWGADVSVMAVGGRRSRSGGAEDWRGGCRKVGDQRMGPWPTSRWQCMQSSMFWASPAWGLMPVTMDWWQATQLAWSTTVFL